MNKRWKEEKERKTAHSTTKMPTQPIFLLVRINIPLLLSSLVVVETQESMLHWTLNTPTFNATSLEIGCRYQHHHTDDNSILPLPPLSIKLKSRFSSFHFHTSDPTNNQCPPSGTAIAAEGLDPAQHRGSCSRTLGERGRAFTEITLKIDPFTDEHFTYWTCTAVYKLNSNQMRTVVTSILDLKQYAPWPATFTDRKPTVSIESINDDIVTLSCSASGYNRSTFVYSERTMDAEHGVLPRITTAINLVHSNNNDNSYRVERDVFGRLSDFTYLPVNTELVELDDCARTDLSYAPRSCLGYNDNHRRHDLDTTTQYSDDCGSYDIIGPRDTWLLGSLENRHFYNLPTYAFEDDTSYSNTTYLQALRLPSDVALTPILTSYERSDRSMLVEGTNSTRTTITDYRTWLMPTPALVASVYRAVMLGLQRYRKMSLARMGQEYFIQVDRTKQQFLRDADCGLGGGGHPDSGTGNYAMVIVACGTCLLTSTDFEPGYAGSEPMCGEEGGEYRAHFIDNLNMGYKHDNNRKITVVKRFLAANRDDSDDDNNPAPTGVVNCVGAHFICFHGERQPQRDTLPPNRRLWLIEDGPLNTSPPTYNPTTSTSQIGKYIVPAESVISDNQAPYGEEVTSTYWNVATQHMAVVFKPVEQRPIDGASVRDAIIRKVASSSSWAELSRHNDNKNNNNEEEECPCISRLNMCDLDKDQIGTLPVPIALATGAVATCSLFGVESEPLELQGLLIDHICYNASTFEANEHHLPKLRMAIDEQLVSIGGTYFVKITWTDIDAVCSSLNMAKSSSLQQRAEAQNIHIRRDVLYMWHSLKIFINETCDIDVPLSRFITNRTLAISSCVSHYDQVEPFLILGDVTFTTNIFDRLIITVSTLIRLDVFDNDGDIAVAIYKGAQLEKVNKTVLTSTISQCTPDNLPIIVALDERGEALTCTIKLVPPCQSVLLNINVIDHENGNNFTLLSCDEDGLVKYKTTGNNNNNNDDKNDKNNAYCSITGDKLVAVVPKLEHFHSRHLVCSVFSNNDELSTISSTTAAVEYLSCLPLPTKFVPKTSVVYHHVTTTVTCSIPEAGLKICPLLENEMPTMLVKMISFSPSILPRVRTIAVVDNNGRCGAAAQALCTKGSPSTEKGILVTVQIPDSIVDDVVLADNAHVVISCRRLDAEHREGGGGDKAILTGGFDMLDIIARRKEFLLKRDAALSKISTATTITAISNQKRPTVEIGKSIADEEALHKFLKILTFVICTLGVVGFLIILVVYIRFRK